MKPIKYKPQPPKVSSTDLECIMKYVSKTIWIEYLRKTS